MEECCELLHNISFQDDRKDKWDWLLDPSKGYLVRIVYKLLSQGVQNESLDMHNIIWNKAAPLKVFLFA